MEIIREGELKKVYWQGECIRCNALVRWENEEVDIEDIKKDFNKQSFEQDEKFPYKMKVSPSFSIIIEKDCPCCGLAKGIVITRKTELPGVGR